MSHDESAGRSSPIAAADAAIYDDQTLSSIFDGCCLCMRAARPQTGERLSENPPEEKLLLDRDGFVVSGARGAFVRGWLLIFPVRHVTSLWQLDDGELRALDGVVASVSSVLFEQFGRPLFLFEHGCPGDRTRHTGRCVDHAHLHCVPTAVDVVPILAAEYRSRAFASMIDLHSVPVPSEPYVLCSTVEGTMAVFDTGPIPSQWMRKLLAAQFGNPEIWDWRLHPMSDEVELANEKIGDRLRVRGVG